ncbi:MAG: hypothetical protein MUP17_02615 [candidate division Zixibacteria bacterium]|nr:hypothetical protein [candidate division Zixibacteria bacterium]
MRRLFQVLVVFGFIEMTVPGVTYAVDLLRGIILDIPQEKLSRDGDYPARDDA